MDTFPPGFVSYRKAFPELMLPQGDPDRNSDTTAEASAGSTEIERIIIRQGSLSTDGSDISGDSLVVSPIDSSGTPMTRVNAGLGPSTHSLKSRSVDHRTSFFSPAIHPKKNLPHNISPALSENSTPSHCNCKKSKCLKLYVCILLFLCKLTDCFILMHRYCECFAALRYCNSCKCVECNNRAETEEARQVAIQVTKDRNAGAFESKVSTVVSDNISLFFLYKLF